MKKVIIVLILLLSINQLKAQSEDVKFGVYRWKNNVPMYACNVNGSITDLGFISSEAKQQFKVVNFKGDSAIIVVLNYLNEKDDITDTTKFLKFNYQLMINIKDRSNIAQTQTEQKYFIVPKSYITQNAVPYLGRGVELTTGALVLPLKFRLNDGDFSNSFTIGGTGGFRFRNSKFNDKNYHNFLMGVGISNITLDSASISSNKDKLVSNLTGLTLSLGYMYQSGKVQAGLFVGWDFLTRANQDKFGWSYQGKPWLSLAFGVSIFSDEAKKDTEQKSKQDPK